MDIDAFRKFDPAVLSFFYTGRHSRDDSKSPSLTVFIDSAQT